MKPDLAQLIAALLKPEVYPEATRQVNMRQTQMSCVFLTDNYAYKIKKAVNLGYVDYTRLERRQYYCQREVELNRRLCLQAYLEVVPITRKKGQIAIGGQGEVIEYAVKMRRLPSELMLDYLLEHNQVKSEMMPQIACKLSDFHAKAETNETIAGFGAIATITRNTEENFSQTEKYFGRSISPQQFERIRDYTRGFIRDNGSTFKQRVKRGRIRDCHGDLHAAHICFCHDLCIYDCIEFNDRFRYSDVAAEVAFLAMDLDHYGRADLSRQFVKAYIEQSHDNDLSGLLNFYKCYRAYVRGKVDSFRLDDPYIDEDGRREAQARAQSYFDLADAYSRATPILIITAGPTGCGKSTLAQALAQHLGLVHISSDITRKRLAGIPETEHSFAAPHSGIYSAQFSHKTYEAMFVQARDILNQGGSVILDATFIKNPERLKARRLARKAGARFFIVECQLQPELAQKRLTQRLSQATASDGTWEIYQQQARHFEPVEAVLEESSVRIDTSRPLAQNVRQVLDRLD